MGNAYAQEGDNPRSNDKKIRETRFKIRNKQGDRIHKRDLSGKKKSNKIKKTKRRGPAVTPAPNPYAGRPEKTESKRYESNPQYYGTPSKSSERFRKGNISGGKIRSTRSSGTARSKVHPAPNTYAGRKQQTERSRAKSNAAQIGGIRSVSGKAYDGGKPKKRITPRTASQPFITRRKTNVYALKSKHGEKPFKGDITGRKIKHSKTTKKTRIIKPTFNPYYARKEKGDKQYTGRAQMRNASVSKRGERAYRGKASGGHISATRKGENAWRNDITGRDFKGPKDPGIVTGKRGKPLFNAYANKIQGRKRDLKGKISAGGYLSATEKGERKSVASNPNLNRRLSKSAPLGNNNGQPLIDKSSADPKISGFSGRFKGSKKIKGAGGSINRNNWNNSGNALTRKPPGAGTESAVRFKGRFKRFELSPGFENRTAGYQGNIKGARKPLKGGGSIARKDWNNKGKALVRKGDLSSGITLSQGNIKGARKPLKGGGSIARKDWNNQGQPLVRKDNLRSDISFFQGNVKGQRKPIKGGGSVPRNDWNNNGQALVRKDNLRSDISYFQGNVKGQRKPLKGGGSIYRNNWNNQGQPLVRKDNLRNDMSFFQGNVKTKRKPLKGGGSIARNEWNNKGKAIKRRAPTIQDLYVYNFQGRFKRFELSPGYLADNIGNYSGNIKAKKEKRIPQGEESRYKGRFKRFELSPGYLADNLGGYKGNIKDKRNYQRKPYAHEDALKGTAPGRKVAHLDSYVPKYAKVGYSKKPNASDNALKGIAPKGGASKAMAFQGNFKVKKTYEKGMHPSARYTKTAKPINSLDEKNKTLKFRIWWAQLFKKNENQPDAVTDKVRKPRYDPKEKDIWYE